MKSSGEEGVRYHLRRETVKKSAAQPMVLSGVSFFEAYKPKEAEDVSMAGWSP